MEGARTADYVLQPYICHHTVSFVPPLPAYYLLVYFPSPG